MIWRSRKLWVLKRLLFRGPVTWTFSEWNADVRNMYFGSTNHLRKPSDKSLILKVFTKPWKLDLGDKLRIDNMFFDLTRERYSVHFRTFVKSYSSTLDLHQTMKNVILSQKNGRRINKIFCQLVKMIWNF